MLNFRLFSSVLKTSYNIQNPFRKVSEFKSALVMLLVLMLSLSFPHVIFLTPSIEYVFAASILLLIFLRTYQGLQIKAYHRRIKMLKRYAVNIKDTLKINNKLFVGLGFRWTVKHADIMYRLKQRENVKYTEKTYLQSLVERVSENPKLMLSRLDRFLLHSKYSPIKLPPPVGGEPALHGIETEEKHIGISESERTGHTFIFGTTRVGKTRLFCNMIAQDIMRGKAVIIIDPKGDLDCMRSVAYIVKEAKREKDFRIVHLGYPDVSAKLNTLADFVEIIDVAGRITAGVKTEGGDETFVKFSWRFLNICARALQDMNEPINYRYINFFLLKPELLLLRYVLRCHPYLISEAEEYIEEDFKAQLANDRLAAQATRKELQWGILKASKSLQEKMIKEDRLDDEQYTVMFDILELIKTENYQKLAQTAKPTLEMLATGRSAQIFSFDHNPKQSEVILSHAIKNKEILYIGLNSMGNKEVSTAAGKAILANLIQSCAGKTYLLGEENKVAIYIDEASEVSFEDFTRLLNKSGGSGFQITAAMQSCEDLEAEMKQKALALMTEANAQTKLFMRVKTAETAKRLTDMVNKVYVDAVTQDSTASDTPIAEDDIFYGSSNRTSRTKQQIELIEPADITNLPKGQFFMQTNGGEIYKCRAPEPQGQEEVISNIEELIHSVNSTYIAKRTQQAFSDEKEVKEKV